MSVVNLFFSLTGSDGGGGRRRVALGSNPADFQAGQLALGAAGGNQAVGEEKPGTKNHIGAFPLPSSASTGEGSITNPAE